MTQKPRSNTARRKGSEQVVKEAGTAGASTAAAEKEPKKSSHAKRDRGKGASEPASTQAAGLFGKADQIGSILAKSLDLAEAGVSLGLNLVNRLGALAQESIINRVTAPLGAMAGAAAQQRAESAADTGETSRASTAAEDQGGASYIANRTPAFAGHTTRVTFSINNDGYDAPKSVRLSVEGFTGRRGGATFDARHLVIEPAANTIAPMDFEKFTLSGTLPRDLPPDVYEGRILVASDETIGIPVRLLVSESPER